MNPWAQVDQLRKSALELEKWCWAHGFELMPTDGVQFKAREVHWTAKHGHRVVLARSAPDLQNRIERLRSSK